MLVSCGGTAEPATPSIDPAAPPPPTIAVTLTDEGCDPRDFHLAPGIVVFAVSNPNGARVKEMEIQDTDHHVRGDVEGVGKGATRSLIVDLRAGSYLVRCPEDAADGGLITVG